jgi:two-component system alkaline phosphatase synthesis response regulator PhoP
MIINENTILLVDDEAYTLDFLMYNLTKNGFKVFTSSNGLDAIRKARKIVPKLILLDIMMPEMDGIETCYELRKMNELKDTVIAFLSARGEDYTQIAGFEAGADDYIQKPIRFPVLLSRLNALTKRVKKKVNQSIIVHHDLKIIRNKFHVIKKGVKISLPRREFEILEFLARYPNKPFYRDEILTKIWGDDAKVDGKTVSVHVSRIRKKLDCDIISTINGVGYCFNTNLK